MPGIMLLVATATLGVKYGWEPADGGIRYIIQIEPHQVEAFKNGEDLASDLPSATLPIRGYVIRVGSGPLPNEGKLPPTLTTAQPQLFEAQKPTDIPASDGSFEKAATVFKPASEPPSPSDRPYPTSEAPAPERHWWPLTLALLALFASVGANVYLGLITWSFRSRCAELLAELKT